MDFLLRVAAKSFSSAALKITSSSGNHPRLLNPKSIALHASNRPSPLYGAYCHQGENPPPMPLHLSDLWTKSVATQWKRRAYPGGCRWSLRVGEMERNGPTPMRSLAVAKTATSRTNLARSFQILKLVAILGLHRKRD